MNHEGDLEAAPPAPKEGVSTTSKDLDAEDRFERIILLNKMTSVSKGKAPNDVELPSLTGQELLEHLSSEAALGRCIEYYNDSDDDDDDFEIRRKRGRNKSSLSLDEVVISRETDALYAVLLFTKVDHKIKKFSVVHTETRVGRHVEGSADERGGHQSHVVVKLPTAGAYDDRTYRCAIEYTNSIPRDDIEHLLCKQLRRASKAADWKFSIGSRDKRGKYVEKSYKYWTRLELLSELRSNYTIKIDPDEISHMVFLKRSEKQSTAIETEIESEEFVADLQVKVTNKQGPTDPAKKRQWLSSVRDWHEMRGYTSKVYFKGTRGAAVRGSASSDMASATDLLFSLRRRISLSADPTLLRADADPDRVARMKDLLSDESLW